MIVGAREVLPESSPQGNSGGYALTESWVASSSRGVSLLQRMQDRRGGARARLARELRGLFLDARRIAVQLRSHGARAPYPAHGNELRRLGEQAEAQAV